jgi:hypothetical protein
MYKNKKRWLFYAIGGLVLNGLGISLLGEAIIQKANHAPTATWFYLGFAALICINSGICLIVDSNNYKYK